MTCCSLEASPAAVTGPCLHQMPGMGGCQQQQRVSQAPGDCACSCNARSVAGSTCALTSLQLWGFNASAVMSHGSSDVMWQASEHRLAVCRSSQPRDLKQRIHRRQQGRSAGTCRYACGCAGLQCHCHSWLACSAVLGLHLRCMACSLLVLVSGPLPPQCAQVPWLAAFVIGGHCHRQLCRSTVGCVGTRVCCQHIVSAYCVSILCLAAHVNQTHSANFRPRAFGLKQHQASDSHLLA